MASIDGLGGLDASIPHPQSPERNKMAICSVCGKSLTEGDRYCRSCGAKIGEAQSTTPDVACIYGPAPRIRRHTCKRCGYTWETCAMIDRERICPKCGGDAPAKDAR